MVRTSDLEGLSRPLHIERCTLMGAPMRQDWDALVASHDDQTTQPGLVTRHPR